MTTQLIAVLAAAGLVTAGVAATSETRSSSAIPAASMVGVAKAAKGVVYQQTNAIDCALKKNRKLPACGVPGNGGAVGGGAGVGGGGVSGGVLAAIAGGLGVAGIVAAAKNDSNG